MDMDFDSATSTPLEAVETVETELAGRTSLETALAELPSEPKPDSEAVPTSTTTTFSKLELKSKFIKIHKNYSIVKITYCISG